MHHDLKPARNHSCWLKVDYAALFENITRHAAQAPLFDFTVPFLAAIWPHIEEDMLRSGIEGVLSLNPRDLITASPSLQRILKPGFKPGEAGYAPEGLIPVLSSFSECLSLSNMAQMCDKRLSFLLLVRSTDTEFGSGDWGLSSICEKIVNLPMLDLHGFYLRRPPAANETGVLRKLMHQAEADQGMFVAPLSEESRGIKNCKPFIAWETLALEENSKGCFPVEIGFWAFPLHSAPDYQIFQADLGRLHGLPADFPVQIGGRPAKVVNVQPETSEYIIDGHFPGPFPVQSHLTGGAQHEPIDLRLWQKADLQNFLGHIKNCPVYLQKSDGLLELL